MIPERRGGMCVRRLPTCNPKGPWGAPKGGVTFNTGVAGWGAWGTPVRRRRESGGREIGVNADPHFRAPSFRVRNLGTTFYPQCTFKSAVSARTPL